MKCKWFYQSKYMMHFCPFYNIFKRYEETSAHTSYRPFKDDLTKTF